MARAPLENARKLAAENPATFEAPDLIEIYALKPGDYIKVCACRERFWVMITRRIKGGFEGTVDNDLLYTQRHGYKYEDAVQVCYDEIYSLMPS